MNQAPVTEKPRSRSGHLIVFVALGLLACGIFFCSKAGGIWLIASVEQASTPISAPAAKRGQAIVVLTGGDDRIRETVRLHRETGLPVLASGGDGEATAIKRQLENDFHVAVKWTEDNSLNTEQNALFTSRVLAREHIQRIILVTHAMHMRRAKMMFSDKGLEVIPAPTHFSHHAPLLWRDFLPGIEGLRLAKSAVHEMLGLAWYWLRQVVH